MPLTPDQILEIQKIIELHHYSYIANTLGHDALPQEILSDLESKGLLSDESLELVKQSYLYGQSLAKIDDEKARSMSYKQFQTYVKDNPIPLSNVEQRSVAMAQLNAGQYCRGLGNTIDKNTGAILIEADQQLRIRFEDDIKTATALNRAKRESVKQLKSDIGWATGDWSRDLERIAVTETVYAVQQGQADYLRKKYGTDSYVSRIPNPGACKYCLDLHIGKDGQPKIFKLSMLENNGSNVGRKAADWRPVIGAIHPNCICSLIRVPDGWGYDEDGDLVPGGKLGEMYIDPEELELSIKNDFIKSFETTDIEIQQIPISIETKEGETRTWINSDGSVGKTVMSGASYGYVKGTTSMDEEELDVFVGPYPDAPIVYIIDQQNPDNGLYDEQKCMLGFRDEDHARTTYSNNYINPDDFILAIQSMNIDAFKRWCGLYIEREEKIKEDTIKKASALFEASTAGDRAPGPNLGINYYIPVPKKDKEEREGIELDPEDFFNEVGGPVSVYTDKEKYEFNNTVIPIHPLVIPETVGEAHKDSRKIAPINKQTVDQEAEKTKAGKAANKLVKGGPYIGPRGGKWADVKHTIPYDEKEQRKLTPGSQLSTDVQVKLKELKIDKIPQATIPIADIRVDLKGDIDSKAVIAWKDTKGKWQAGYTPAFHKTSAEKKWKRVEYFKAKVKSIKSSLSSRLAKAEIGSNEHQGLTILSIIAETGLRPGSVKSVESHNHYGISTLKKEHVELKGNRTDGYTEAVLNFIGKSGKENTTIVQDKETVKALRYYVENKEGFLFNPNSIDISKKVLPKGMKVKDFRTIKATESAKRFMAMVKDPPPLTGDTNKDKKLLAKALFDTSKKVATILNNTPAIAKASYIHPIIFEQWAASVGASEALWKI